MEQDLYGIREGIMAEPEEVKKEEIKTETEEPAEKKGRGPLKAFLVTLVFLLAVLGALIGTRKIVVFRRGVFLYNTEGVSVKLEASEVPKLEYFPNLKLADLRGSACAKELYAYSKSHPGVEVWYTVDLPSGATYDEQSKTVDFSTLSREEATDAAKEAAQYIQHAEYVKLDLRDWTEAEMDAFRNVCPNLMICGEKTLEDTARNALKQIEEKRYDTDLLQRGIPEDHILKYGFAFQGKSCLVRKAI